MPVGRAAKKDGGAEDAAGATSMPSLHPLTRMGSHPNKPDKAGKIRSAGPVVLSLETERGSSRLNGRPYGAWWWRSRVSR